MKFYNSKFDKENSHIQFYAAAFYCVGVLLWFVFKYFWPPEYQPRLINSFFLMSYFVLLSLSFSAIRLRLYALNIWICSLFILIFISKTTYKAIEATNIWLSIACFIVLVLGAYLYWLIFASHSYCIVKTARKLKFQLCTKY